MDKLKITVNALEKIENNKDFLTDLNEYKKIRRFPLKNETLLYMLEKQLDFLNKTVTASFFEIRKNKKEILDKISCFGYLLEEYSKPCDCEHIYEDYPPEFFLNQFSECGKLENDAQIILFQKNLKFDLSLYKKATTKEELLTLAHVFSFIPCQIN